MAIMERDDQDLESHPVIVSFNFSGEPASPNDEFKQADFLGAYIENLDGVDTNPTPKNTSSGNARSGSDVYNVGNGHDLSSVSITSMNTIVEVHKVMNLSHKRLCMFIDARRSMQGAEIVRSCTFVEKKLVAPHRCVLLELRRPGRQHIWVRLERKPTSGAALVAGTGKTPSNDVVSTMIVRWATR